LSYLNKKKRGGDTTTTFSKGIPFNFEIVVEKISVKNKKRHPNYGKQKIYLRRTSKQR